MPQPQFSLSWRNISVQISEKNKFLWKTTVKTKTVLENSTARSNSLIAIMGSSGSGKTTLLSAISGRRREKSGVLMINNTVISNDNLKNMSGYVYQQDIFTEYMTVLEHLKFMAALQLPNINKEKRNTAIKQILIELSLERQSGTLINNLSGGERRRLSLAGELISNPFILFCDEPTTGLDSYSAVTVIQKLQTIALSGKIVLAAIHQPSSQLFHYFHNIMLLAEGKLVFQGTDEEAKSFFESVNLYCPSSYNPADFYIKCLTQENISKLCELFEKQKSVVKEHCHRCNHFDNVFLEKKCKNNIFSELKWLLWRSYIENKRNKTIRLGGYFFVMIELLLVASFYSQISFSDKNSEQNIQGFLSFIGSEISFTNMYSVINVFPGELAVFLREKNLYSSGSYFTSKILSMIPLSLCGTILYMTILFVIVRFLNGLYLWIRMTYITFLVGMASCGLGLAFSATFSTVEYVDLIMGPLEFILLLVGGVLIKVNSVPFLLTWVKYLSPFYYAFDSLSNSLWKDVYSLGNCTGSEAIPCYNNGSEVLQHYGIYKDYDTVAFDILYLHILTIVLCIIGFAGIWRKKIIYSI